MKGLRTTLRKSQNDFIVARGSYDITGTRVHSERDTGAVARLSERVATGQLANRIPSTNPNQVREGLGRNTRQLWADLENVSGMLMGD